MKKRWDILSVESVQRLLKRSNKMCLPLLVIMNNIKNINNTVNLTQEEIGVYINRKPRTMNTIMSDLIGLGYLTKLSEGSYRVNSTVVFDYKEMI